MALLQRIILGAAVMGWILLVLSSTVTATATAPAATAAAATPPPPPPPICTWNSTAVTPALPGCCGYGRQGWQSDGCSCGCCKHNFSGAVPPAPTGPVVAPGGRNASTARFLSFYDECSVDLLHQQHGMWHEQRRAQPRGRPPPAAPGEFESLPLIYGMCMPNMSLWGCWWPQGTCGAANLFVLGGVGGSFSSCWQAGPADGHQGAAR